MRSPTLLLTLLLLATALPVQATPVELTISGDDGPGCSGGKNFCFNVQSGDITAMTAGAVVTLTFQNTGNAVHNLHVTTLDKADPDHQATPRGTAFATTAEEIPPGTEETITFTVPAGASGVYLWCSVEGHEQYGMWLQTGSAPGGSQDSPLGMPLAFLAVTLVALAARRR